MRSLAFLAAVALIPAARADEVPLPDLKKVTPTALDGHGKEVGAAGFSRDGKLVATGCYDRAVRVFDAATGKATHSFPFGDPVDNSPDKFGIRTQGLQKAVAFSPDGTRLAAVGGSWLNPPAALATVFDLPANKEVFTSKSHRGMIWAAAFTPDGKRVVTAGHDSTLKVFDADGKEQGTFKEHDWVITALAVSPDGKAVASACCNSQKRSIRIWDPATLKQAKNIPLKDNVASVHDLAYSPDGKHLAGVSDGLLNIWDVATGERTVCTRADAGVFRWVAYSPDGKRIALAGGQGGGDGKGILRVYDVAADKMYVAFVDADAGKELIAVAWPTADAILAVGVRGSDAKVLRVELGK